MFRSIITGALAATIAAGCAGSSAQLRTEKERLEEKVAELRAEARAKQRTIRDLQNQVALLRDRDAGAVADAGSAAADAGSAAAAGSAVADIPELPVEVRRPASRPTSRASGEANPQEFAASAQEAGAAENRRAGDPGDEDAEDADDEEVIVLTNVGEPGEGVRTPPSRSRGGSRSASPRGGAEDGGSSRPQPRADAPIPDTSERLPEMSGDIPEVSTRLESSPGAEPAREPAEDYQRYLQALQSGNHEFAIAGFRNFIGEFSEHPLADNSQYWLAEAYYDRDEFERALEEFRAVVANFPGGSKVPDALLKIGFCHVRLGDEDAARRALERVLDRYGDTPPAELAEDKLGELGE